MPTTRLNILFDKHVAGTCTPAEKRELAELVLSKEHDESINALLEQAWRGANGEVDMPEDKADAMLKSILVTEARVIPTIHRVHFRRSRWWAAAAILVMVSVGGYFMFFNKSGKHDEIAATQEERFKNDVAPGREGAILRLANGQAIVLDTAADGSLAMQSNTQVRKIKGTLVYQPENSSSPAVSVVYNTLETPRGRKYKLVLPDGTEVWLDAEASITFPSMFIGSERRVKVTGQAYFEVRADKDHPFKVDVEGRQTIEVLGTHFNINAYGSEANIKTSLLEGSIKLSSGNGKSVVLKRGEQGQVTNDIKVVNGADLAEVMAWKNGRFHFENTSIETIMRQVERWYDVQVEYQDKIPHLFVARIPREVPLTELLKLLELTERVHFKIDGKKIKVMK